jgi:hypothetical protein
VGTKFIAIVLLVTTIAGVLVPSIITPELQVLVGSWLSNEPKMLIKLLTEPPMVGADSYLVMVERFPTLYNPTRDDPTEEVNMSDHAITRVVKEVSTSSEVNSNPFVCDIQTTEYTERPYRRRVGYCITWVRGPRIYSIDGLWVSFKIYGYPWPSAIYLEVFEDYDAKPYYSWLRPESQVQWKSVGRKLTPSEKTRQTSYLTGNYSDRVYFKVEYVYEHRRGCVTMGVCFAYWLLYPAKVANVVRSAEEPSLPNEVMPYTPPPPPPYAREGRPGSGEIGFLHKQVVKIDVAYVNTIITVTLKWLKWVYSFLSTLDFYDSQYRYATPTLPIYSTRYFWQWYLDDDPVTYEVLFAPRQV